MHINIKKHSSQKNPHQHQPGNGLYPTLKVPGSEPHLQDLMEGQQIWGQSDLWGDGIPEDRCHQKGLSSLLLVSQHSLPC